MTATDPIAALAKALLYEGFSLYPYRVTSLKNQQRYFFGGVYPPCWSKDNSGDPHEIGTQVPLEGSHRSIVSASIRFLHFDADGTTAIERRVTLSPHTLEYLVQNEISLPFTFTPTLVGCFSLSTTQVDGIYKVELKVRNTTEQTCATRDAVLPCTMASLHAILSVEHGSWISLLETPSMHTAAVANYTQNGLFPVLVGCEPARDTILAAPITLYDYPRVAPESHGDLFDGTEIDEILTLRLLTLSDAEKSELASAAPQVRDLLERVHTITPDEMRLLHGAIRPQRPDLPAQLTTGSIQVGTRVRLNPRKGGDIFDLALAGRLAKVTAVEKDFDGQDHVVVVLDDDPGADLGEAGFHGHRFFFTSSEVEPL